MIGRTRRRRLIGPGTRALRLAGYWHAAGDLDEAARNAERALCLAGVHGPYRRRSWRERR